MTGAEQQPRKQTNRLKNIETGEHLGRKPKKDLLTNRHISRLAVDITHTMR